MLFIGDITAKSKQDMLNYINWDIDPEIINIFGFNPNQEVDIHLQVMQVWQVTEVQSG
ncbi:hypothetical protein FACS1894156_3820 [Bacteroidia bacterium]|nr:hypothetical protein FACS1894156_3820 [Bacteroidia bacterium]